MNLIECMKEECVEVNLSGVSGKDEVLKEIASLAKKNSVLDNVSEESIFEALKERESVCSTGIGEGIAIPHCRFEGLSGFVTGIYSVPQGVDFESIDKEKAKLLFFIIGPEDDRDEYIRILSAVSRVVSAKRVKEELFAARDAEQLRELFLMRAPDELVPDKEGVKCVFNIYLQQEDKLIDILEVLSALGASFTVCESRDPGAYLNRTPLFSTFWNTDAKNFNCLISGCLNKKLANEMIRGIDVACGGLDEASGVMIAVCDALVCKGSLYS